VRLSDPASVEEALLPRVWPVFVVYAAAFVGIVAASILRGSQRPSEAVPRSRPFSTITRPRRIVVTGQPVTRQPSHGL